ncbi:unnamed protein product [Lymnaea stagnalis]|uniref:Uncharacterized protein n=1 Tax=Lymnaea stagnalis TaxID=6523 RepID=A0AAV2IBP5_LYMST
MMLAVRLNAACLLVVLANTSVHLRRRSSDPALETCSPLCDVETELEMQCALSNGCFDIQDQDSDSGAFSDCWAPCWELVSPCFNLCVQSFDLFLKQCFNSCQSTPDDQTCMTACFYIMFSNLKNDVLYGGMNGTHINDSTSAQVDTATPSSSALESSSVDSSLTSYTARSTNVILAALEIDQILDGSIIEDVSTEHLAQPLSDLENTVRYGDKLNSIELPDFVEKVDSIQAKAIEDETAKEGRTLLAVLTSQQPPRNDSRSESSQGILPEPTNGTYSSVSGQQLDDLHSVKHFDGRVLKILLESYDRSVSDYLKSKRFQRKNFSGGSSQNASQITNFEQGTEDPGPTDFTWSLLKELTSLQSSNTFTVSQVKPKLEQGFKRIEERQNYLEILKMANLKFLQLDGLTGPLPKDTTLEAYLQISRRRPGLDSPVLIG